MRNNTKHHANVIGVYLEGVQSVHSLVKIMFPGCQNCTQVCGFFKVGFQRYDLWDAPLLGFCVFGILFSLYQRKCY